MPSLSRKNAGRHDRSRRKDIRRARRTFLPDMVDSLEPRALLSGTFQVLSNFPTGGTGTMMLQTELPIPAGSTSCRATLTTTAWSIART
jgi:hypothetical protein